MVRIGKPTSLSTRMPRERVPRERLTSDKVPATFPVEIKGSPSYKLPLHFAVLKELKIPAYLHKKLGFGVVGGYTLHTTRGNGKRATEILKAYESGMRDQKRIEKLR